LLLTALFLIYVAYLQSSVLLETRRHARELDAQRELAEHAEASRIHELRSSLDARLQALGKETQASLSELGARLSRLETDLRQSIEECQNTLAAILSEMDDRLRRATEPERQRRTE
jgi:DNA anti-recombination protein RmuC